ncbi:MAG TPA: hypothetical protein VGW31_01445 [Hanamia sp.]|nr:hypothetical protein [Hanamia sp.]
MKNLLLLFFCSVSTFGFSQVNMVMPPEANLFYTNAMKSIKPEIKSLVETEAKKLKGRNINADSLSNVLKKVSVLKRFNQGEIEAVTILIMVQVSKNADVDLKNLVMSVRKNPNQNSSAFDETKPILEHKSRIAENVSELMKRISPSPENVINNLK